MAIVALSTAERLTMISWLVQGVAINKYNTGSFRSSILRSSSIFDFLKRHAVRQPICK